jgi:TonB family protein
LSCALLLVGCAPTQPSMASIKAGGNGTGHGLFIIDFDYKTGQAVAVHVVRSTGSAKLDATTMATLKKWRVKQPGTVTRVKVPITYTIEGAGS